ncbi:MAG: hypothetical protein PHH14_02935 [Candidatus Margulisbacteria bacterium]|nr:hypothetical protein [Candidatus Margulisiibacteriota bacterium]
MFGFVLSGCSEQMSTEYFYYSPSWTRGGQVIHIYGLQTTSKNIIGTQTGSSYAESVATMEATAGAAVTARFDVTSAKPYQMTCSPSGEYVAYLNDLDSSSSSYGSVIIRNIAGGSHSGLDLVELAFAANKIKSFDWSNDGTKIVYCTSTEVRTVNIDGTVDTLVVADTGIEFVSWKYGTMIAFVRTVGSDKILSLINPNGSARVNFAAASSVDKPQISSADTSIIYGLADGAYCKVDTGTSTRTTVLASCSGELPRLSPDAAKVVYSKTSEATGIYLLDIAAGTETAIR